MTDNEDLVKEFLIESYENLDRLDRDLVELEKDPRNQERLGRIFRTIHTIKGTVGFLGYTKLESIAHIGENLLSRMRDLELVLDVEITTGLLRMIDAIRRILASVEATGQEGDEDHTELVALLTRLNQGGRSTEGSGTTSEPREEDRRSRADDRRENMDERRAGVSGSSLRVDVVLLDKLMNLVGELVLARNQILQFTATQTDSGFVGATGRLNLVTSELQEGVMKTRMQPIGNIWSKFPRIVRDLATSCGKQLRIEMEGKETDLDKTIIEAIKDPLTHVVRNAVDHGVESPADRVKRGKNPEGLIRLRAFHEGSQINIEISDDGAGIDPAKIRGKAVQRGLITPEDASAMSDLEAIRLVFLPGVSTAEQVTNVSGRGVGMDVVKTNIEKIGGQVDIQSKAGEGTTLKIKIPLTLAIIPALMVAAGGATGCGQPQPREGRSAMTLQPHDIIQLVGMIWSTTLGIEARPSEGMDRSQWTLPAVEAQVHITGTWQGVVVLHASEGLATRIAQRMFNLGDRSPRAEDKLDAFGEIANITGGKIKGLLSEGDAQLSLPAVVRGMDYAVRVPGSHQVGRYEFVCEGEPLVVTILQADQRASFRHFKGAAA